MDVNKQLANALDTHIEDRAMQRLPQARALCGKYLSYSTQYYPFTFSSRGEAMFNSTPRHKVLCSCGTISEIDSLIISTKKDLGKSIECRTCRNQRIARQKEEFEREFYGIQELEE